MKSNMTGKQFRKLREALGFKKRAHIADRVGATVFAVEKWENGQNPVPEYAAKEIRRLWKKL